MRDGKGPSEKVMGRVSRVPLRVVIPIGVALLVVMMIVSVGTGPVGLGVGAIMRVIVHEVLGVGQPQPQLETTVVMTLRLPRVLFGVLVGAALAVSGASLQSLLRNPLAGPGIIGVSGGASMGAVAAIVLLPSLSGIAVAWVVPAAAFLGGLLVTSVIYALARPRGFWDGSTVVSRYRYWLGCRSRYRLSHVCGRRRRTSDRGLLADGVIGTPRLDQTRGCCPGHHWLLHRPDAVGQTP